MPRPMLPIPMKAIVAMVVSIRRRDRGTMRAARRPDERHHHDAKPAADPEVVECGLEIRLTGKRPRHQAERLQIVEPEPAQRFECTLQRSVVDAARFGKPALMKRGMSIPEGRNDRGRE